MDKNKDKDKKNKNNQRPKVKQRDCVCIMSEADKGSANYMADLRHAAWEAKIPRRRWVTVIYSALSVFEGELYTFDMKDWFAPNIEDVFGKEEDSARWISNFAKPRDEQKPIAAFQKSITDRVTLIDLYFRLVDPEKAALFGHRDAIAPTPQPTSPGPSDPSPGGPGQDQPEHEPKSFMLCYLRGVGVIYIEIPDAKDFKLRRRLELFFRERAKALGYHAARFRVQAHRPIINSRRRPPRPTVAPKDGRASKVKNATRHADRTVNPIEEYLASRAIAEFEEEPTQYREVGGSDPDTNDFED